MRKPALLSGFIVILALSLTACGKTAGSSPVAPDAPVLASSASATLSGTVGTGSGSGLAATTSGSAAGVTVSVVGSTETTTVDATGRFRLVITPSGNVQLKFSGPGVNSTATVGTVAAGDTIEINITINGGTAEIEDSDRASGQSREIEGRVEAVPPSTAAGTFKVAGKLVTTTASTVFRHGDTALTFANVTVGTRVHVKAAPVTGTVITATEVNIQNPETHAPDVPGAPEPGDDRGNDNDHGDKGQEAEVSGAVSGLGGTCPAISFTIGTTRVTTSASTRFELACASVKNATRVEVKGTRAADGSIAASRVKKD